MEKTEKPKQKRINVKIGDAQLPDVQKIQYHYGHQTISETIRYLVVQGINVEVARMVQAETPDNMQVLKDFTEVMRQLSENPVIPGLMDLQEDDD